MKALNNEIDLGNVYTDWLKSKSLGGGHECIRFGQYVYNNFNIEYKNSYSTCSELDAYNLLSEYLYQKGLEDESE